MVTRYGTKYFIKRSSAMKYYRKQGYSKQDVDELVHNGIIAIGEPKHSPGETLRVDEDGRYYIEIKHEDVKPYIETKLPCVPKKTIIVPNLRLYLQFGSSQLIVDKFTPIKDQTDVTNDR
jgi:hypothetical protein